MPVTAKQWQHIASLAQGEFFNVRQDGNAVAIATPFDKRLAQLSRALTVSAASSSGRPPKPRGHTQVARGRIRAVTGAAGGV
ncbi:MAG: hypothetical protein GKR94_29645 [Gammaproteobacteria bacterium]|nr:hypothetical protein [Gammaproteobacteria bacterium]